MNRLPEFELLRPRTLQQAVNFLGDARSEVKVLAGGTDLLANMKHGVVNPKFLMSLEYIPEFFGISLSEGTLRVGAMSTLSTLLENSYVQRHFPALLRAAQSVGTVLIQNRATVGGNLLLDTRCQYFNRSALWRSSVDGCLKAEGTVCHVTPGRAKCVAVFSSDLAGPMIAYGASVELVGPEGRRILPLESLYRGVDGLSIHGLKQGELVVALNLPVSERFVVYQKMRARGAIDFPWLSVTAARGGVGFTGPVILLTAIHFLPVRAIESEQHLAKGNWSETERQKAAELAMQAATPLGTHGISAGYRRRMIPVLVKRVLEELTSGQPRVDGVRFDSTKCQ